MQPQLIKRLRPGPATKALVVHHGGSQHVCTSVRAGVRPCEAIEGEPTAHEHEGQQQQHEQQRSDAQDVNGTGAPRRLGCDRGVSRHRRLWRVASSRAKGLRSDTSPGCEDRLQGKRRVRRFQLGEHVLLGSRRVTGDASEGSKAAPCVELHSASTSNP